MRIENIDMSLLSSRDQGRFLNFYQVGKKNGHTSGLIVNAWNGHATKPEQHVFINYNQKPEPIVFPPIVCQPPLMGDSPPTSIKIDFPRSEKDKKVIAALREALRFYAYPDKYLDRPELADQDICRDDCAGYYRKPGQIARDALNLYQ